MAAVAVGRVLETEASQTVVASFSLGVEPRRNTHAARRCAADTHRSYLPLGHLGHGPPPFELQKNLAYDKKCNQNAPFSGKNVKNFLGRGHSPSSDPTPTGEGNAPDQTAHPRRRSLNPLQILFPISIITLDSDADIDEFEKSNRRL